MYRLTKLSCVFDFLFLFIYFLFEWNFFQIAGSKLTQLS